MTADKRPAIGAGTLSGLTNILGQRFHTLVVDRTGIQGNFDFWSLPPAAEWEESNGSLFTALGATRPEVGTSEDPGRNHCHRSCRKANKLIPRRSLSHREQLASHAVCPDYQCCIFRSLEIALPVSSVRLYYVKGSTQRDVLNSLRWE